MIIPNLTIHMMVKNEERYIRQTLESVLPYVDEAVITDTGSTDKTKEYISVLRDKYETTCYMSFLERPVVKDSIHWNGNHLSKELTDIRNEMFEFTGTDWVWQVDGDEIYTPSAIEDIRLAMTMLENKKYKGIQVPIKWCISDSQYILPGPFPKTLRIFQNANKHYGKWVGEFPNEFFYVDGVPITMHDPRCFTTSNPFMHMSIALHPERRPANGIVKDLTKDEERRLCLNI